MKLEVALEKSFGSFRLAAGFNAEGRRIGVFGPSGSGKSTLVGMLAGLTRPDSGVIRLDGETLFDGSAGIDVPPDRRRIGVVFQHAHLFPHLSVRRNLLYGYKRIPRHERKIDPEALTEVLNLGPLLGRGVGSLSGGERQRVALGRAVLACPRLILMDEPLNGLDEGLKHQIIPYLKRVFAEFDMPLLFISHSLLEMRLMTDRVLEFSEGRLVGEKSPEELARSRIGAGRTGYVNLLRLSGWQPCDDLWSCRWGNRRLVMTEPGGEGEVLAELASKDVTLFKRHPEASSARNILPCRVSGLFQVGNRVGVDLDCGGQTLVAQVVGDAARELDLRPGSEVVAVIKASAFRPLG